MDVEEFYVGNMAIVIDPSNEFFTSYLKIIRVFPKFVEVSFIECEDKSFMFRKEEIRCIKSFASRSNAPFKRYLKNLSKCL